jgi:hypothetical protein
MPRSVYLPRPARKRISSRRQHRCSACRAALTRTALADCVLVTATSVQDRDGARPLLDQLAAAFSRVRLIWADGGYAGKLVDWAHTGLNRAAEGQRRRTTSVS